MRITNLHIKNYRSCASTKVNLREDLTALIGINGAGKSNILSALLLLKQLGRNKYHRQNTPKRSLNHSTLNFECRINKVNYSFKLDLYFDTDQENNDDVYYSEIAIKRQGDKTWQKYDADILGHFRHHYRITKGQHGAGTRKINTIPPYYVGYYASGGKQADQSAMNAIISIADYFTKMKYFSATYFSDPTNCPVSIELDESLPTSPSRSGQAHYRFIYDLYDSKKSNKTFFNRFITTVNHQGIGLIDSISFTEQKLPSNSYEVKIGGRVKKIKKNRNLIIPTVTVGGIPLSPNQLSEGTFKTLALAFYILKHEEGLLIIEEPEVCVHHGLLSSVIELIKLQSKGRQIVISTHSDYVLDRLEPESLLLVSNIRGKGTVAKSLSKAISANEYKALRQYLNESGNLGEYWKEGGLQNG